MTTQTTRTPETAASFASRVERRSRLKINRIPNAEPEVMLGGAIICTSSHGTLVFTDWSHQEEDGTDIYSKAVIVNRGSELAPADHDADGIIPQESSLPDWATDFDEVKVEGEVGKDAAFAKMEEIIEGEEFVDNYRYADVDDHKAMEAYKVAMDGGCCGCYDGIITFGNGRKAIVGCNFGH